MTDKYELRLYDDTLLSFELTIDIALGYSIDIVRIEDRTTDLLPLDMELTGEGVLKWLERRVIPKNRTFVEEILHTFGLSLGNTKGIIDVCKFRKRTLLRILCLPDRGSDGYRGSTL